MGITKVGEIAVSSLWGGDRVNFENAEFEITIRCAGSREKSRSQGEGASQ